MEKISAWFWQASFWHTGQNSVWNLEKDSGLVLPKSRDLLYVPLFSLFIYALRLLFERYVALPLATKNNLDNGKTRKIPQPNADLEKYYKEKSKEPSKEDMIGLAKRIDWSAISVRNWFKRKRNSDRPSVQAKFCETSWRFLFYAVVCVYGIGSLWKSPWLWDTYQCYIGFPRQNLEPSTYIYYMLEMSFYLSLLFTVMGDIKRKDFKEQVIHHLTTLALLFLSYMANLVRVGTLVMAVHDISDVFLEGAKCLHYLKCNKMADATFVIFAITFFVSRLYVLPFWVLDATYVKSYEVIGECRACDVANVLLFVLQGLHLFWFSIILKMAYKMIIQGKVQKDDRSDVEEQSSDEDESHANENGKI